MAAALMKQCGRFGNSAYSSLLTLASPANDSVLVHTVLLECFASIKHQLCEF